MELSAGDKLGAYEILAPLGAGGMGEVYRARDARLGRDVAVKVLPGKLASDPGARRRFEREAKAAAVLSHPNILALYDVGVHEGVSYAVMELLEGETLRARLDRAAVGWSEAVEIGAAVADGLAAAHAKGGMGEVFRARDARSRIQLIGRLDARAPPRENRLDNNQ